MANALASRAADGSGHGPYRAADVPIYKAFQQATGLAGKKGPDGWPGTATMNMLAAALAGTGVPMPNVTIYPWKKKPGWGGANAPALSDWNS